MSRSTLRDPRGAAEICRERGWAIGTKIVGYEGYGPTVIQILGIGEQLIFAKRISHRGEPTEDRESLWGLDCRDWQEVQS